MSGLHSLAACAGRWHGPSVLQDPHSGKPERSDSTAEVSVKLDGRFVAIDYTWSYRGEPQQGFLLAGHANDAATVHWADSWHMGGDVMALTGTASPDGALDVRGSYGAPPGPDWGWRIVLSPSPDALRIVMHNIEPDGTEHLAVEADLRRA